LILSKSKENYNIISSYFGAAMTLAKIFLNIIGPETVLSVVLNKVQKFTMIIIFFVKNKNILPIMNAKIKIV